jgi:hypothetical protein
VGGGLPRACRSCQARVLPQLCAACQPRGSCVRLLNVCVQATGRAHSCTQPTCITVKTTLAKAGLSTDSHERKSRENLSLEAGPQLFARPANRELYKSRIAKACNVKVALTSERLACTR